MSALLGGAYLDGVRVICRELLDAKDRGELTLEAKTQQRLEDVERQRYQLATERALMAALAAAPDPAYRQRYLELVREELGMNAAPAASVVAISEAETRAQSDHDVAWSRFDRLIAQGVRCKAAARHAWETGTAHIARLDEQLRHVREFL